MQDGYYWYYTAEGDFGDLSEEEPQIVQVAGESLSIMGGDYPYTVSDANGRFVGPIEPPENK